MAYARQLVDLPRSSECGIDPFEGDPKDPRLARVRAIDPDLSRLAASIEFDIVPRLMLAHEAKASIASRAHAPLPTHDDVREFTRLVIEHDVSVAAAYVEVMRSRGVPDETLLLHVLAPAARLLGDLWVEDLCSFVDVTVGLSGMQQILRGLSKQKRLDLDPTERGGRALISVVPGEQHTFGLFMIEEFFRRAGWSVRAVLPATLSDLVALVSQENFNVIGISVSCDPLLDTLGSIIQSLRRASLNRRLQVLVGGHQFLESPDLVARVGADATAANSKQVAALLPALLRGRGRYS